MRCFLIGSILSAAGGLWFASARADEARVAETLPVPVARGPAAAANPPLAAPVPGPGAPPAPHLEYRTITCYRTEYRTTFKEVRRVVRRPVTETVMKEVTETELVPHWRQETRERT